MLAPELGGCVASDRDVVGPDGVAVALPPSPPPVLPPALLLVAVALAELLKPPEGAVPPRVMVDEPYSMVMGEPE